MAGRNQHVQDSAVAERRLRPIYEWIDTGNPKKALHEIEKLLRKSPKSQCAKALKALALLQLGREQESIAILNILEAETPTDNSTLQAMTICFRDIGQLERVCQLYEKAIAIDPTNEELHTHLFMSYVRINNYKLQQKSAMALYKIKPKNPYYFWAVMSIFLQGIHGEGATDTNKRTVLLSLAERMIDKLIYEEKLEAEQEVHLYVMVLEYQNKYKELLSILDGPHGSKLLNSYKDSIKIKCLAKLQRWPELNSFCKELLNINKDRWDIWKQYINSIFQMKSTTEQNHIGNCNSEGDEENEDPVEKVHEFICSSIESITSQIYFKNSAYSHLRGPYLARLELYKQLNEVGRDAALILGDVFELFVEYFRLIAHKTCCVKDLHIYLHMLTSERRLELADRLLQDVELSETTIPETEHQMLRHISALQLSRLCGNHAKLDVEYLQRLTTALVLLYENGAQKFHVDQLITDQGSADAYALLASHTLFDLSKALNSSAPLIDAIVVLENLLKSSPSNFNAKLLCIRLYHMLGGADGAQKWYECLDVKHMQLDSLFYIHCGRLLTSGCLSLGFAAYDATLKFFAASYRDSVDNLALSFKFGSFLKFEEFVNIRDRLKNSINYTICAMDRMLLDIFLYANLNYNAKGLNMDSYPRNINWDALSDNNDYEVYVSWDPDCICLFDRTKYKSLFEQDCDLAKIQTGILNCLSCSFDLLKSTNENREQCTKTFNEVCNNWVNQLCIIEKKQYTPYSMSLSRPLPSRLTQLLLIPWRPVIECLVQLILKTVKTNNTDLTSKTDCDADMNVNQVQITVKVFKDLSDRVENIIKEQNESDDSLRNRRVTLEIIVNSIELLCITSILCSICWELLSSQSSSRKAKKKPAQQSTKTSTIKEELQTYAVAAQHSCVAIEKALEKWKSPTYPGDISDRLKNIFSTKNCLKANETQENVMKHIKSSHTIAVSELRMVLTNKIKIFKSLLC